MLKEFREFIMKGNVLDLAVAVIIGGAFGLIVASFVKDIVMPPIGLLLGQVDFANLMVVLKEGATPGPYASVEAAQQAGAVTLNYGLFLNTVVNFLIVAAAIFMVVKAANRMKRQPTEAVVSVPSDEVVLLTEIRDLMKSGADKGLTSR